MAAILQPFLVVRLSGAALPPAYKKLNHLIYNYLHFTTRNN